MFAKPKLLIIILSAAIVVYGFLGGLLERVSAEEDDAYRQLAIFNEVVDKVKSDYVDDPDLEKAFQGAVQGMMEALDPFSSFVPAQMYRQYKRNLDQAGTVGLTLSKRFGYMYVVAVDPGSAAEREGLRTGDLVESIDGEVTMRMSAWEATARLQGPAGSQVEVRVVRARRTEPSTMMLLREAHQPLSVDSRIPEEGVGLLRIPQFEQGAADQVSAKLKLLEASEIRGLLIDLRGNARGELSEAVRSADLLLSSGLPILSVRNREGAETSYVSLQEPILTNIPVVLLLDGGTSGPAEVFAAALQDHQRAEVVGERSNGRGSTQSVFQLNDGAALFVSTALYIRPQGKPLQGETLRESGVNPDVRAPNQEFVTNFYFENTTENFEDDEVDDFYRRLDEAVEREQLSQALERVRAKVLEKVA